MEYRRSILLATTTRFIVVWPELGEREAPVFGVVALVFREGKVWLCIVPVVTDG